MKMSLSVTPYMVRINTLVIMFTLAFPAFRKQKMGPCLKKKSPLVVLGFKSIQLIFLQFSHCCFNIAASNSRGWILKRLKANKSNMLQTMVLFQTLNTNELLILVLIQHLEMGRNNRVFVLLEQRANSTKL